MSGVGHTSHMAVDAMPFRSLGLLGVALRKRVGVSPFFTEDGENPGDKPGVLLRS